MMELSIWDIVSISVFVVCVVFVLYELYAYKMKKKLHTDISKRDFAMLYCEHMDNINMQTRTNKKGFSVVIEDSNETFKLVFVKSPQELYTMRKDEYGKYKRHVVHAGMRDDITFNTIENIIVDELNKSKS